jgi:hypothetical protein
MHYILITLAVYIGCFVIFPQQVAALTLLAAAWFTSMDIWQTVSWLP